MRAKLEHYGALLLEWNKIHNLGGNLDASKVEEYVRDSIYPLEFIEPFGECIDVGSGAGFPAVPLAICSPDSAFVLVEPRQKRCAFLHYVCAELGLQNITIKKCRIQELPSACRADLITSRALMETRSLIALSEGFLREGGHFLFYKGTHLGQEIDLQGKHYRTHGERIYFYERKMK